VETVIHHRHEFVLYSLWKIEPMKVDMMATVVIWVGLQLQSILC